MAGGSSEDNPVPINVVPMVDVIFCLCVFFMCSFKFKQLEGAFDSWLPKNKGNSGTPAEIQEIRIALYWDTGTQKVRRQFGQRVVEENAELEQLIKGAHDDWVLKNKPDVPLIIDGDPRIPWKSVIEVVNMAKALEIQNIEFALGAMDKP
ncbi:MAG: ExbD/TolR family protein [Planctomycetota bacterium]